MTTVDDYGGIGNYTAHVLMQRLDSKLRGDYGGTVLVVYLLPSRMVIALNPLAVKDVNAVMSNRFVHDLSTALQGRRIVVTNTRGVFYQVSYKPQATDLAMVPLDLTEQPGPLSVPLGMTRRGKRWMSITKLAPLFAGGARGMGKTRFIHGIIQALLHGGQAEIYAWDGKDGTEFGNYEGRDGMHYYRDFAPLAGALQIESERRNRILKATGYSSAEEYNEHVPPAQALPPLVLVVDEAAFVPAAQTDALIDFIARGRYLGIYPVLGTQRVNANVLDPLINVNLTTRAGWRVADGPSSTQIIGRRGAEKLPQTPGRYLLVHGPACIEVQAFEIEGPQPERAKNLLDDEDMRAVALIADATGEGRAARVSIPRLVEHAGYSEWQARKLLDRLTDMGVLAWGDNNDRYVAPWAWELAAQATQAASSRLKPDGEPLKPHQATGGAA